MSGYSVSIRAPGVKLQLQDRNHLAGGDNLRLTMSANREDSCLVTGYQVVRFARMSHCEQMVVVRIARHIRRRELLKQHGERSHRIEQPSGLRRMDTTANG